MRRHMRTSTTRLAFAGLGVAAALAAASAGSSTAEASGRSADPVDPRAIRSVDFGDVPQPGSACRQGLRFAAPASIPLRGGESQVLDLGRLTQLAVDSDVAYGDIDGDGVHDAVVHTICSFGASGAEHSVHAWTLGGRDVRPLASVDEPPAEIAGGPFAPVVADVAAGDGSVTVTWAHHAADDPHCCPSQETAVTYQLADGDLRPRG